MALYGVSFSFTDEDGQNTERTWYVEAASVAAAETRARALAELVSNVMAGAMGILFYIRLPFVLIPLAFKATADPGSEVEHLAVYKLGRAGTGGGTATFTIPTFNKDAFTVPGGDIDRTDADVIALETELLSNGWADYRGGDYTTVHKAEEGFG